MDWLSDNFQIVALVLIAFAGWIKSRMESKTEEPELPEEQEPQEGREDFGPDQQWERAPSVPPPLTWSQPPPPMINPAAAFEAARESAAVLKHQQDLAERLRQIRETKATTSGGAKATRARVAASKALTKTAAPVSISLRSRLHDKGELRRAFVLKEILAPPLSER